MNFKDFLKEEKEEKKKRKELKKQKKELSKDEKKYKIFGIILGFAITFGAIFYSCNNLGGGYTWNNVIGITDEIVTSLEKVVDESVILPNGRIGENELNSCMTVLNNVNIDLQEDFTPSENFSLTDRQLGAIAKEFLASVEINFLIEIYDLDFYLIGENIYQKSIVYLNLSNLIVNSQLPSVYLITISKVEILNNTIVCMSSECNINNLDEQVNNEIIKVFNKNSGTNINEIGNNVINAAIELFVKATNCKIDITNNLVKFNI